MEGPIRIDNSFTFKFGHFFTGFGVGCGVGIGLGRPLDLGAIPVLNEVMSVTRGAMSAKTSLSKLGPKNIKLGIGCGVGFGHGFGAGLAVKPEVLNQSQTCPVIAMIKMMMNLGVTPNLPFGQGAPPASSRSGINAVNKNQISPGRVMQGEAKPVDQVTGSLAEFQSTQIGSVFENTAVKGNAVNSKFSCRTEKVPSKVLQNPVLNGEEGGPDEADGRLRSENNLHQTVLKQKLIIKELEEENEKLRQILGEGQKVPYSKLEASSAVGTRNKLPCSGCFDCRRKQRKKVR